jgi:aldehyde:ferredoxin oxidoreductase
MNGYMGKLLRVNLSQKTIVEEPLDFNIARDYIGGAGLATRIIFEEVPADTDPLSPQNKLLFMTGPMTGTLFPTTARYEVCTKSPLTGIWLDASSSGRWGNFFKRTGYDGIIIEGASDKPVYLWITDDHAEIRDASAIWGQDTTTTQDSIKRDVGETRASVACIGPAGEKQVLLACIVNDEGRAAGRGGAGAVMGSKNLKAIAVNGTKRVGWPGDEAYRKASKAFTTGLAASIIASMLGKDGTAGGMDSGWVTGDVPVKNWRQGIWKEGSIKLGGFRMAQTILKGQDACLGCPIRCARHIVIDQGPFKMDGPGPEYETLAMLGTLLMNDNLESVCWANDLCNRYGIDTISTGGAIGFAMEAYEKGLITKADTGGLDLSWGNVDAILEMVKLIGERRGLGELLGQGTKRAAEKIGNGAEAFAVHVKGMEVPAHDPRAFFSMAPNYATSPRGACHLHGNPLIFELGGIMPDGGITYKQGRFDHDGKGLAAKTAQDFASVANSMIVCSMAAMTMQPSIIAGFLTMACGTNYTSKDVLKAGERMVNLQRLFNLRCGITGADDKLPKRLLEPTTEGGQKGRVPDVAYQLKEYYRVRGWTPEGIPTAEKIKELGLEFATTGSQTAIKGRK